MSYSHNKSIAWSATQPNGTWADIWKWSPPNTTPLRSYGQMSIDDIINDGVSHVCCVYHAFTMYLYISFSCYVCRLLWYVKCNFQMLFKLYLYICIWCHRKSNRSQTVFIAIPTKGSTQLRTTYKTKEYHWGSVLFNYGQCFRKCYVWESPNFTWKLQIEIYCYDF